MPSVLIVDDLSAIHEMLAAVIQPTGYEISFASDGEEALGKYKAQSPDVVLADISMQPMDGITLLQKLKVFDPDCVIILMTGYASTETAVKALKFGAFDYIQKPFKIDELLRTLKSGIESRAEKRERRTNTGENFGSLIDLSSRFVGNNAEVQRLRQQTAKLMGGRAPLLLFGERGTGKKIIAEAIHEASGEDQGPLIVIDCALRDEAAFFSGLIGQDGQGGDWVTRAKGGTLYLQQMHQLPLDVQEQFVNVIKNTSHEARIICGTEVDLEQLTDEGRFKDELFYRIAAFPIHFPPLRKHPEDLPLLVKHFLQNAQNPSFESAQIEFAPDAMERMTHYYWPGNVAELAQVVTSLSSTTKTRLISAEQLPMKFTKIEDWPKLDQFLEQQKAGFIRRVLRLCDGDRDKAATILGCELDKVEQDIT